MFDVNPYVLRFLLEWDLVEGKFSKIRDLLVRGKVD